MLFMNFRTVITNFNEHVAIYIVHHLKVGGKLSLNSWLTLTNEIINLNFDEHFCV